jgi:TRAP-type mannitol/chloroaromatic compound transport system permease small subunit
MDTTSRAIGTGSISLVFGLNESLIILVGFLPLGYAQLAGEHVSFTVLYDRLPKRFQSVSRAAGYLIALPLIGWMTWVSVTAGIDSWLTAEVRMDVAQLPVWPARLALAIGLLAYLTTLVYGFFGVFRNWAEFPLEDADESEGEKTY